MYRVNNPAVVVAVVLWAAACFNPTERSDDLSITFDALPDLFLKDSVQLDARLVDAGGLEIDNAQIDYTSSDPTVVSVDAFGMLLAVGSGTATVTAEARLFENTDPAVQPVTVRGLLEIDSIRPLEVRFGEVITMYGVGLSPDSLILVSIGAAFAPDLDDFSAYVPEDTAFPNRFGALTVWVPPPADPKSVVSIIGFNGVRVHDEDLRVFQRDLYEPNDTLPRNLGELPTGLVNPALSFESRGREDFDFSADWYQFDNTGNQDRTLVVFGTGFGGQNFNVFVSPGVSWVGAQKTFQIDPGAWSIGSGAYFCGGLSMTLGGQPFQPFEERFPAAVISLDQLGSGTYNLLTVFDAPGDPQPYEIAVFNSIVSIDGTTQDPAEENDWCDVAKNLSTFAGVPLTVDNPHDIDWFKFTVGGGGQNVFITATSADSVVDVDLYLLADERPTDLPIIDFSTEFLTNDTICARDVSGDCVGPLALPPGDYFLAVIDFAGETGPYRLGASFTSPPAPILGAVAPRSVDRALRESFVRKRDATGGFARGLQPRSRP
jgi:hypothetical protein